jgi:uncharacterized membrane protein YecN with MAPEG domain
VVLGRRRKVPCFAPIIAKSEILTSHAVGLQQSRRMHTTGFTHINHTGRESGLILTLVPTRVVIALTSP